MSEIKLPESFTVDGYTRHLVERTGDLAIYRVIGSQGRVLCFDAVRIVHKPDRVLPGGKVLARESYPSPRDWGKSGWSCSTLERARERLKELQGRTTVQSGGENPPIYPDIPKTP